MTEAPKKLYRSRSDRMLAGVAGGMAEYFGLDATIMRVLWVVGTIFLGVVGGILVYLILALIVPENPQGAPDVSQYRPHQQQPPTPPPPGS